MSVIKWAGGKSKLLPEFKQLYDMSNCTRYVDLFCGSLAIPYSLGLKNVVLNDLNTSLITTYTVIKDHKEDLLPLLEELSDKTYNNSESYNKIRLEYNNSKNNILNMTRKDKVRLAGIFIYLNKRSFNGLYRENSKGEYNVPYRRYNNKIYDTDSINSLSSYLGKNNVVLTCRNYKDFSDDFFRPGDLVYLDPPYYPINGMFTAYLKNGFGAKEQLELSEFCRKLDRNGIKFIISNSPCKEVQELYKDFFQYSFRIGRQMRNAKVKEADNNKDNNEILIWNYKKIILISN
jgi:DNA adenine methylase